MLEPCQETLDFFQGHFGNVPMCLAGGSVRDALLERPAKDYDLFVFEELRPEALNGLERVDLTPFHKSEPFLKATVLWQERYVQIMVPEAKSVSSLLDTFDWNVSMFAFDGELHQREQVENIAPGMPLKLEKVTYPQSTLRRGFRFSERFGMKFEEDDILLLCAEIVSRELKNKKEGVEP